MERRKKRFGGRRSMQTPIGESGDLRYLTPFCCDCYPPLAQNPLWEQNLISIGPLQGVSCPQETGFLMSRNYLVCGALAFALGSLFAGARRAPQEIPDPERTLFDSANRERAARGMSQLKWDGSLARAARKHAELMAEENILVHQLPGEANLETRAEDAGASFSHITENIGKAEYASQFHDGWM